MVFGEAWRQLVDLSRMVTAQRNAVDKTVRLPQETDFHMDYYCKFLAGLAFDGRFWQRNQRGIADDGRRGALRPLQNFNFVLKLGDAAQLNLQIGAVAGDLGLERAQLHAQHRIFVPRDFRA